LLSARGRRRLRALPRGAEDAVVGYWRFERTDAEAAAEKAAARAAGAGAAAGPWGLASAYHAAAGAGAAGGAAPSALEPLSCWST
jgi:hypothetical protein